ncbi:hypothetical protein ACFYOT_04735 [Saccharothrix saharensis]|uniref:hypothetical protein n=1 Tax=Saccharothrix saharensis TaxID=571190 RepID=UPI003692AF23
MAAVDVSAPSTEQAPARPRRRALGSLALGGLVVLPVLLATAEAIRSPKLNFWDYWVVLVKSTDANGGLTDGAWTLHNEHPAVLASTAFWLDAKFFDGYNYVLGLFCVALSTGMLLALFRMLPPQLRGDRRLAVMVALSFLVFSSSATEYYGIGMSGTHWLLGLAPAVISLSFAHHGRTIPALVFAVIGSLGHGAAFPVWVVLALVAWLRRERAWRVVTPLVLGVVVLVLWSLAERREQPLIQLLGADSYLATALTMVGQAWVSRAIDVASFAGAAIAVVLGALLYRAARDRNAAASVELDRPVPRDYAGWIGLGLHALMVAVLIGYGRARFSVNEGLSPRMAMVSLLAAGAVVVLLAVLGPEPLRRRVIPLSLVVAVGTFAVGTYQAGATRSYYPKQPVLAVAMHVEAESVMHKMTATPDVVSRLRGLRAYPFSDDFTLGCRGPELGSTVDLAGARELPAPKYDSGRTMGAVETGAPIGDTEILGWAQVDGRMVDCVLVVDRSGLVVGGGAVGLPRPDVRDVLPTGSGRSGFSAVAEPGREDLVVVVSSGGTLYRITTVV